MTAPAIQVRNLGKLFRIGARQDSYKRLTETVTDLALAPLRRLQRLGKPVPPDEEIWALKDVSFDIMPGEVVGVIGRNGAGKSTLLKILSRITEPTTGEAIIRGRVGSLLEVGTGFHPELTGRENIFLNGAILGMKRAEIRAKFDEIVAFAEIDKFIDTPVKRYSSGMYVRLAFAVAAHLEPEILLVDEVLAVGDAQFQKKCLGKMGDVAKQGRTIVLVSHNLNVINRLCEKCALLSSGRLENFGPSANLTRQYLRLSDFLTKSSALFPENETIVQGVLALSVTDSSGQPLSQPIQVADPFDIRIRLRLRERLPNGYAMIILRNSAGDVVMVSYDWDSTPRLSFDRLGDTEITVSFPAPLLAPDSYTVSCGICQDPSGVCISGKQDAVSFQVVDLDGHRASRPGNIFLPLRWHYR